MTEELNGGCLDERDYPPLPKPNMVSSMTGLGYYGDDQMRAYVDADRARRASLSTSKQAGAEPVTKCRDCHGTGVDGDCGPDGRTIDIECGACNGTGRTRDAWQVAIERLERMFQKSVVGMVPAEYATGYTEALSHVRRALAAAPPAVMPAAPSDAADAARWRFAMDWGTKDFAVCYRDGNAWVPIKNNGPIDAALSQTMQPQAAQPEGQEQAGAVADDAARYRNLRDNSHPLGGHFEITEGNPPTHLYGELLDAALAAPGAAIAAREQEATPLPKGDLSKVWQAADDVCEWLNYEVSEKSPGLLKSIETLNEAMGRAEIRAGRAVKTALASRDEAPATPQAAIPAAPSEALEGQFTTPYPDLNDLLSETYWMGKGPSMDGALSWLEALERVLATLTQPTVQQAQRVCGNPDCGWKGHTNRMLGSIGPLCPECGETTEENNS